MNNSLFDRFSSTVGRLGKKTAFNFYKDGQWHAITYEDFHRRTLQLARLLGDMGVGRGDNVAICAENMPQWCASYMAIVAIGAVAVPVDSEMGAAEIANILKSCKPHLILCSPYVYPRIAAAGLPQNQDITTDINQDTMQETTQETAQETTKDMTILRFDSGEFLSAWGSQDAPGTYDTLKDIYKAEAQDIASIIYTSGTTGQPKGVMLTHGNFCTDADALHNAKVISQDDNLLSVLPLHHTYPFMGNFIMPMTCGATITYPIGLKGADLTRSIREQGVTILIAVPRLLEMLLKGIETKINARPLPVRVLMTKVAGLSSNLRLKRDINIGKTIFKPVHEQFGPKFRFMASGGAKLAPEVMTALEAYGFTVLEGYGLTETSPVVTFNPLSRRKVGSAGRPLPGVEIKIAPVPDQQQQQQGQSPLEGEILIRGGMVFGGYYENPQETAKVFTDDWFHTGDVGYLDSEGYLYITGREKDVIVLSSGKNVYPEDVERRYAAIPIVKEICVFSKDTKTLRAIIVPDIDVAKEMQVVNIHEYLKWETNKISQNLPPYMRLSGFVLSTEPLPKTRLGKLRRFLVADIVDVNKTPEATHTETLPTDILSIRIMEVVKGIGELEDTPSVADNVELDLGFDSLKRLELIAALENLFQIHVSDDVAANLHTVQELIDGVRRCLQTVSGGTDITERLALSAPAEDAGYTVNVLTRQPSEADIKALGLTDRRLPSASIGINSLRLFFQSVYGARLKGLDNLIPPPYILCPNHVSYLDAFVVAAMLPIEVFDKLYFQGAEEFFRSPLGMKFARLAHVIPINPDLQLNRAMTLSAYLLREGYSMCIFPEGGRSLDGSLLPLKKGVGILAIQCGVPLIPLRIGGTYEALPRGTYLPRKSKVTLKIGEPLYPTDFTQSGSGSKDGCQLIVAALQEKMAAM
ncbi:Long-chain-fatty-acid--CoA ligase [Candidatus Magnetobacterium bavaricum]|uniref:Long-chain-fatty-acid--CoA ligase n=1 Tax=Candidatus Magnetobacterium bavaricum TaxID=29290 RepID=A0A0F3GL55_9BACT|nr:Long-chain-fatty-acid--CoA ligase [Candidatus Magnetobacterium bavaricum]